MRRLEYTNVKPNNINELKKKYGYSQKIMNALNSPKNIKEKKAGLIKSIAEIESITDPNQKRQKISELQKKYQLILT